MLVAEEFDKSILATSDNNPQLVWGWADICVLYILIHKETLLKIINKKRLIRRHSHKLNNTKENDSSEKNNRSKWVTI